VRRLDKCQHSYHRDCIDEVSSMYHQNIHSQTDETLVAHNWPEQLSHVSRAGCWREMQLFQHEFGSSSCRDMRHHRLQPMSFKAPMLPRHSRGLTTFYEFTSGIFWNSLLVRRSLDIS
jgi:hypothetical protein